MCMPFSSSMPTGTFSVYPACDYAYDYYELQEEEALTRLRDADNMSECTTDGGDSSETDI